MARTGRGRRFCGGLGRELTRRQAALVTRSQQVPLRTIRWRPMAPSLSFAKARQKTGAGGVGSPNQILQRRICRNRRSQADPWARRQTCAAGFVFSPAGVPAANRPGCPTSFVGSRLVEDSAPVRDYNR